jgi:hypothetical protein
MPGEVVLCNIDRVHAANTDLPPGILVDRGIHMYYIYSIFDDTFWIMMISCSSACFGVLYTVAALNIEP